MEQMEMPKYDMAEEGYDVRLSPLETAKVIPWLSLGGDIKLINLCDWKRRMAYRAHCQRIRKLVEEGQLPKSHLPEEHPRGNHPLAHPPNVQYDGDRIVVVETTEGN